ncbi:hypothetical protein [Azospirillum sp. sgz302134]
MRDLVMIANLVGLRTDSIVMNTVLGCAVGALGYQVVRVFVSYDAFLFALMH